MTTTADDTTGTRVRPDVGVADVVVDGPTRLNEMTPDVVDRVAGLLRRVVHSGLVDFGSFVDDHRVQAEAVRMVAETAERRSHMVVMRAGERIVGMAVIEPSVCGYTPHRAYMNLFIVDPDFQAVGLGRRLLAGAVSTARELGREQLYVSARAGSGLPEFYQRHGWTTVGVFPDGWRLHGLGDFDEIWLCLRIAPTGHP